MHHQRARNSAMPRKPANTHHMQCPICKEYFTAFRSDAKYCSTKCRMKANRIEHGRAGSYEERDRRRAAARAAKRPLKALEKRDPITGEILTQQPLPEPASNSYSLRAIRTIPTPVVIRLWYREAPHHTGKVSTNGLIQLSR